MHIFSIPIDWASQKRDKQTKSIGKRQWTHSIIKIESILRREQHKQSLIESTDKRAYRLPYVRLDTKRAIITGPPTEQVVPIAISDGALRHCIMHLFAPRMKH